MSKDKDPAPYTCKEGGNIAVESQLFLVPDNKQVRTFGHFNMGVYEEGLTHCCLKKSVFFSFICVGFISKDYY